MAQLYGPINGLSNITEIIMDSRDKNIGFIGAGNMAGAIIKGLIKGGAHSPDHLAVSDNDHTKIRSMVDDYGIKAYQSNRDLVEKASIIVFSVKPQVIRAVLAEISPYLTTDHLIISIAAGIPVSLIEEYIGRDKPIIRVMPNTPALIQRGVSALAQGGAATSVHMKQARGIFDAVGKTVIVDEGMMDAVTALSGSGPGFVFRIMEAFVEAGMKAGFDRETALMLTTQTFLGSAHLADESGSTLSKLREMVTSPGGTTAAGLNSLEAKGIQDCIQSAVRSACDRSMELGGKNEIDLLKCPLV
jgi:pyrroline-5-carboxylate reductase